ncbi:MAG: hypothetical protein HS105_02415 [Chloracidobacterium sp.]|nr:hypothetical protein [Chloracidobacterium sp.]MCO5333804.1 hypothetical protein [Pyrinomonadaceae bacterium]
MMIKAFISFLLLAVLSAVAAAQATKTVKRNLTPTEIDGIIKKFTDNERAFRNALSGYVFNRNARVDIIGLGGQVAGTFVRNSFMMLKPDGERFEKVLYSPMPTTPPGFVTPEDLEDLGGVNPFALEPEAIPNYNFSYVGVEHIDDFDLYVFDVTPKFIPNPKKSKLRLFTGRVWVDTDSFMILKTKGKAVPETDDNKFPVVETTRDQIDGKYWFPIDSRSDDELVYKNGSVTKIKMRVTFSDYRMGETDVKILDDDEPVEQPSPTPKKDR